MSINLISSIVAILAGLVTIINFIVGVKKTKSVSPYNQQSNYKGDNYNLHSTKNINTVNKTNNYATFKNENLKDSSSDDHIIIYILLTIIGSIVLLSVYSLTYKALPALCLILFAIKVFKDLKVPFENNKAKSQWYFIQILSFFLLLSLLPLPESISYILDTIPAIEYETSSALFTYFLEIAKFIKDLYESSLISFFNIFGRIAIIIMVVIMLTKSIFKKTYIQEVKTIREFAKIIIVLILFALISNIEFFWGVIEPLRNIIDNWLN